MHNQFKYLKHNSKGETSIIVTLIMSIVITLMVIGFAQMSNKANQQALDNTLSTAAYYAAESGINAAYVSIQQAEQAGKSIVAQTRHCTTTNSGTAVYSGARQLNNPTNTVEYTCLLVNPSPPSLNYAPLNVGISQVVPVFGQTQTSIPVPVPIAAITISWQADGAPIFNFGGCSSIGTFPAEKSWPSMTQCTAGVLQVDIAPAYGWTSPSQLQDLTKSVFLYPAGGASTPSKSSIVNGAVLPANCSTSPASTQYDCSITLQTTNQLGYYLHITPIYENADISITATSIDGKSVNLYNAQALIDSTGKAKNELKRIQERVSINPVEDNNAPSYALQSRNGICKLLKVYPGVASGAPIGSSSSSSSC
jgi:type II secretory pathway pseudopilin PulG